MSLLSDRQTSWRFRNISSQLRLGSIWTGLVVVLAILTTTLHPIPGAQAAAGINSQLNFQGRLLTASGAVVPDGDYNMRFKIYCDGNGDTTGSDPGSCTGHATNEHLLWTETWQNSNSQGVTVKNGYFSIRLGSITSLASLDWNQDTLWLSMDVGGTSTGASPTYDGQMTPFKRLGANAYAFNAGQLQGLGASNFVQLAPNSVQADATNNASVFINKTSGTGNILQLQKSGSDVVTVNNTGTATFAGLLQGNLGLAASGAAINLNASSNFATNINTGTSTGTVNIGNSTAGAIAIQSGGTISITAATVSLDANISVTANHTLHLTGGNTASRPGSPTEGMVYYDTTTHQLLQYNNSKWVSDRTDAVIVAASNSSQADKDAADYVADGNTGAANDGDQVQINAALTAASGRKVVLLAGTYTADATILVPNNTTLAGVGKGTLIQLADLDATDNLIENSDQAGTATGIVIRDLSLDGNKTANTGAITQNGIYFVGGVGDEGSAADGATLENLWISNFETNGIEFHDGVTNSTVIRVVSISNDNSGMFVNSDPSSTHGTITASRFQSNGNDGLRFAGWYNWTITNNVADNNTGNGFYIASSNTTVTGNTANDNGNTGFTIKDGNNSTITGNTANANAFAGIALDATNSNTVTGNNLAENGSSSDNNGISLTTSDSNTITGNSITDTACTTTCYAINITNAGSDTNYLANNSLGGGTINDSGTGTVYGGQTMVTAGDFLFRGANSASAFRIQNAAGSSTYFAVDSSTNAVNLANATINLNANSNNTTNINTGTSTGTVNIGTGTGAKTINVGNSEAGTVININAGSTSGHVNIGANGVTNLDIDYQGRAIFKASTATSSNFRIQDHTGAVDYYLVDETIGQNRFNSSVCIIGAGSCTQGSNAILTVQGAALFADNAGSAPSTAFNFPDTATTLNARVVLESRTYASNEIGLAIGVENASSATARAIAVADARTTNDNNPTISVYSPDESTTGGLSWDGSNNTFKLKTQTRNSGASAGIQVSSGNMTAGSGTTTGAVTIKSGDAQVGATNGNSGAVTIDAGLTTGSGTAGTIHIGTSNASALVLGRATGTPPSVTIQGNTVSLSSSNGTNSTTIGFMNSQVAGNVTYNLDRAVTAGTYEICTTAVTTACTTAYNGGGGTLQQAYNNSGATDPQIQLSNANGGLKIRDASSSTIGNLLQIQNSTGATTYLGLATSALSLGSNVNILMSGASAYISNSQGWTDSEAFGLNAVVANTSALAVGANSYAYNTGVAVGSGASAGSSGSVAVGAGASTGWDSLAIGHNATTYDHGIAIGNDTSAVDLSIALGNSATTTTAQQLVVGGSTASTGYITNAYLGSGVTDATPQSIVLQGTGGSGSNIAGASFTLAGGRGTGTGNGGNVNIQVAKPAGSSGSSLNSLATVASFSGVNGAALFQNSTDSTTAFQVQNASATALFIVDTTNARVYVGPTAGDTVGTLLVLGNKTNAGDPTGVEGAMYYNSSMKQVRCYIDSTWQACNGPEKLSWGTNFADDFLDGSLDNSHWTEASAGTGAGSTWPDTTLANRPGIMSLETGTTSTGRDTIWGSGNGNYFIGGGEEIEFAINVPTLADGTNDYIVHAGLCDVDSADCDNGVYIEYDRSASTNWRFATAKAGTRTKTSSSTAVTTGWHRFRIVANTAGTSVSFYMDGTLLGSAITTNIPDTNSNLTQQFFGMRKTAGTTERTLLIDYFQLRNNLSSQR